MVRGDFSQESLGFGHREFKYYYIIETMIYDVEDDLLMEMGALQGYPSEGADEYGFYAIDQEIYDQSRSSFNDSNDMPCQSCYYQEKHVNYMRGMGDPTTSHRDLSSLMSSMQQTDAVTLSVNQIESRRDNPLFQVLLQEDIDQRSQLKRSSSLMLDMDSCIDMSDFDCDELATPTYQTFRRMVDYDNHASNYFELQKYSEHFSPREQIFDSSECYSNRKRSRFG